MDTVRSRPRSENSFMLPTDLSELTAADIEGLVESEVAESLTLDYKLKLPSGQSEEKREFLYDVAAMANSAGGNLIYGIAERRTEDDKPTGLPTELWKPDSQTRMKKKCASPATYATALRPS